MGKGDFIVMAVWWADTFAYFADTAQNGTGYELQDQDRMVFISLEVMDVVDGTQGKWEDSYNNGKLCCYYCWVIVS